MKVLVPGLRYKVGLFSVIDSIVIEAADKEEAEQIWNYVQAVISHDTGGEPIIFKTDADRNKYKLPFGYQLQLQLVKKDDAA